MHAIYDFAGKKTIIVIVLRLAMVKRCDSIYLMGDGRVTDRGSLDELTQGMSYSNAWQLIFNDVQISLLLNC